MQNARRSRIPRPTFIPHLFENLSPRDVRVVMEYIPVTNRLNTEEIWRNWEKLMKKVKWHDVHTISTDTSDWIELEKPWDFNVANIKTVIERAGDALEKLTLEMPSSKHLMELADLATIHCPNLVYIRLHLIQNTDNLTTKEMDDQRVI